MYVLRITKEIRDEALFEKQVLCKIPLSVKVLVKCIMIVTAYILFGILLIPVTRNYLIEHRGRDYYVNRYLEENHSINYIYGELFILSNNINIIKNIRNDDCWSNLNYEERCEVMETLTFCEAQRLGVPYEITVQFSDEMQEDTEGTYTHSTKSISYNEALVMSNDSENVIFVVLHEVFHVYQYSLIEVVQELTPEQRGMKCFAEVDKWASNVFNYVSGDTKEELEEYFSQPFEWDAAEYAYDNISVYHSEIDKLLCEEEMN